MCEVLCRLSTFLGGNYNPEELSVLVDKNAIIDRGMILIPTPCPLALGWCNG
jgi:hypothetical protein